MKPIDVSLMAIERYFDELGLKWNPFSPAPLESTEKDMQLFVGRFDQVKQFDAYLASVPGNLYRIVLMGTYGVGKTSLINKVLWQAKNHKKWKLATIWFVAKEDLTYLEFVLRLMDKMISILLENSLTREERKAIEEIRINLEFEDSKGTQLKSEITGTLSAVIASVAGKIGVKAEEIRKPLPWTERTAVRDFESLIAIMFKYFNGAVVAIDEVDYLSYHKAQEVLRKGREDIFQKKNFLFIFCGTTRFRALLDEIGSPVREVIDNYVILEPFKYPEETNILSELVQLRLDNSAKSEQTGKKAFDPKALDLIFTLSGGVARRIVRFLQASLDTAAIANTPVTDDTVLSAVKQLGKGHYTGLPLLERDIIKMLSKRELLTETDFEEVKKRFSLSDEKASKIRSYLESQGLITSTIIAGENFFTLSPELRVYVLNESKIGKPIIKIETAMKMRQFLPDEQDPKVKKAHLRTADLLDCEGHSELLYVEYDSMPKEEKLNHCDKLLTCVSELADRKLDLITKQIEEVKQDVVSALDNKEVKVKILKIGRDISEYAKTILAPDKTKTMDRVVIHLPDDKEVYLNLRDTSFSNLIVYEALMRQYYRSIQKGEEISPNAKMLIRLSDEAINGVEYRKKESKPKNDAPKKNIFERFKRKSK